LPPSKHILAVYISLSLASFRNVSLYQLLYARQMHHGLVFVLLCLLVLFAHNARHNGMMQLPCGHDCITHIFHIVIAQTHSYHSSFIRQQQYMLLRISPKLFIYKSTKLDKGSKYKTLWWFWLSLDIHIMCAY